MPSVRFEWNSQWGISNAWIGAVWAHRRSQLSTASPKLNDIRKLSPKSLVKRINNIRSFPLVRFSVFISKPSAAIHIMAKHSKTKWTCVNSKITNRCRRNGKEDTNKRQSVSFIFKRKLFVQLWSFHMNSARARLAGLRPRRWTSSK